MSGMEMVVLSAITILLLFWLQPGMKAAIQRSRQGQADWRSVLLPLGLVVMFVIFLIAMV